MLLLLAKDLKNKELEDWTRLELGGYLRTNPALTATTKVPEYRRVTGLWHNDRGQPLIIRDANISEIFSDYRLRNGVAELEELSRANSVHSALDQTFPPMIKQNLRVEVTHYQFHSREVAGVLTEIRSRVIDWLDKVGVDISEETAVTKAPPLGDILTSAATVFYSWQADLSNETNRGFIENCLRRAIKELKAEGKLRVDARIDRDTEDMSGSPDIAAAIFEKIESCALFVCDVSIINKGASGRSTPNPNVLIELGFAVKALGWNRVVCILNQSTGEIADLPFDFRHRRVRVYRLNDGEEKSDATKLLTCQLKADLESTFSFVNGEFRNTARNADTLIPHLEVLDATLECQPPILNPAQKHVFRAKPKYAPDRLIWTITTTLFIDSVPGKPLTIPLHRCKGVLHDRYTSTALPLSELAFQSTSQSQVSVDDSVLLIRGPGKVSVQAYCETTFRDVVPDTVKIDLQLPVTELEGKAVEVALELVEAHQGSGWPLCWKHRPKED